MNLFFNFTIKNKKSHGVRRIEVSSAYSLVVNCLSDANIKNIKIWQKF